MRITLHIRSIIYIFLSLSLIACGGGGGGGGTTPATTLSTISGQVLNASTGQPIPSVTVSADGQTAVSDGNGNYMLTDINDDERMIVTFSNDGLAEQSRIINMTNQNQAASLTVSMLPIDLTQTFDPNAMQTIVVPGKPASVELAAASLVKSDGSAPDGDVTVEITVIDPTVDINLMPGDLTTDTGGGVLSPIESFGAITVNFTDSNDNKLNLAQGEIATIRIPLADKTGNPPATIPLYYYDETTGLWVEEGSATLVTDPAGDYYQGNVSHFSTWNADILYTQVLINGCVEDSAGNRIEDISVVTVGEDYSGTASAITNTQGQFSVAAKPDSSVILFGLQFGIQTNTVKLQSTAVDTDLTECLVLSTGTSVGDTAVSIKLTWGEVPNDLDAYISGPNNIEVNFTDKGSLDTFPFIQLDVDDLVSFGPEVITVFNFPIAGTYRYSVNNFSRLIDPNQPGMTASPTRVELNVNGDITLFTPPAGEGGNDTWNVFDIIVAPDGTFTVTPVNTWTDL